MWPLPYFFTRRAVGVEVSSHGVNAVQISLEQRELCITGMASNPLPTEDLTAGKLATALTQCIEKFKYPKGGVVASLAPDLLTHRNLLLPMMDEKELATALHYETQAMLDQDVGNWVARHCVLDTSPSSPPQMKILLMAAPRQQILLLYDAFNLAKLSLRGINIPYFGLWRFARQQLMEIKSNCALIYINDTNTLLLIIKNQTIGHLRLLPVGYQDIQQQGLASYSQLLDDNIEIYRQQLPVGKLLISGGVDMADILPALGELMEMPVEIVRWPPMLGNQLVTDQREMGNFIIATGLALQGCNTDEI